MALLIKLGFAKLSLNTRVALTANDDSGFLVGVLDYKRGIFGDDGIDDEIHFLLADLFKQQIFFRWRFVEHGIGYGR